MLNRRITRREALKAGAAVALPLVGASATLAEPNAESTNAPTIGISTAMFHDYTNRELSQDLAKTGVGVVQLFLVQSDSRYWKYNKRSDLSSLTAQQSKAIAHAYRSAGISIHSIGVYTNMIHPDENERKANMEYFEGMMRFGTTIDVHTFVTEAGHFHPYNPAPGVPYYFREEVWRRMVTTGKDLAKMAEKYDATVLLEPFLGGFLASSKRTRLFIEEVGSPRIRALLDPANLLEVEDIEDMFTQLGPWIDCLHAKDWKLHMMRGLPPGQGNLDYPKFVDLAAKHTPHAPLILEYVGRNEYKQAFSFIQKSIRRQRTLRNQLED